MANANHVPTKDWRWPDSPMWQKFAGVPDTTQLRRDRDELLAALIDEHVHRLEGPVGQLPCSAWDEHAAECSVCALIERRFIRLIEIDEIPKLTEVGCEKCSPGIEQAWFRCPKCQSLAGPQRAALIARIQAGK